MDALLPYKRTVKAAGLNCRSEAQHTGANIIFVEKRK